MLALSAPLGVKLALTTLAWAQQHGQGNPYQSEHSTDLGEHCRRRGVIAGLWTRVAIKQTR
jgi:hypothetical protein